MAVLIASLSRSFWVGGACAAVGAAFTYYVHARPSLRDTAVFIGMSVAVLALALGIVFALVRFPFPKPSADLDASLLRDRATKMEAGAASRWSLLPVMAREISHSPLWGFGFGKTLTYTTSDPRITSSTVNGEFTTSAFEWGWFDLWLKLGLIGVAAYAWLLWFMLKDAWRLYTKGSMSAFVVGLSILALAVLHFFTPYLNHPLGFTYLAVAAILLSCQYSEDMVS